MPSDVDYSPAIPNIPSVPRFPEIPEIESRFRLRSIRRFPPYSPFGIPPNKPPYKSPKFPPWGFALIIGSCLVGSLWNNN